MANHPNRSSRRTLGRNPDPHEIKEARLKSGLEPREAASVIYASPEKWMAYESGSTRMHPAFFELFMLKRGLKRIVGQ